jgi:peptidoglycan/LPS O-acetylase OafA/YrhL
VFVVNSHLESFYPNPAFAGDGLIGYSLFFFVSGLGLTLSSKKQLRSFRDYYWRRFIRIYPTLWLLTIPPLIIKSIIHAQRPIPFFHQNFVDYLYNYLWPTENTFVGPLMVCYVILYLLLRHRPQKTILIAILALLAPLIGIWLMTHSLGRDMGSHPVGWWLWRIAFLQILLLGAWLSFHLPESKSLTKRRLFLDGAAFLVILCIYIFLKYAFNTGHFSDFYPLLFFIVAGMLWPLFRISCNPHLNEILLPRNPTGVLINLLGTCCLEIYFVQDLLISWHWLSSRTFPFNILLLWILLIPSAYLAERIVSWIRSGFRDFSWKFPSSESWKTFS